MHAAILDELNIGVCVWELGDPDDDRALVLRYPNRSVEPLAGLAVAPAIGRRLVDIFPFVDCARLAQVAQVCRSRIAATLTPTTL